MSEYASSGVVHVAAPRDSLKVYVNRDGLVSTQIPVPLILAADTLFRRLMNLGTRLEIVREQGPRAGEAWAARYGEAVGRGCSPWAALMGLATCLEARDDTEGGLICRD